MATLVTADIGGTHCRCGLFSEDNGQLALERQLWFKTADLTTTDDVLEACAGLGVPLREADAVLLAIAGPVQNPLQARTTNAALSLDLRTAKQRYGLKYCKIINDFVAQAYACLTEVGTAARRILPVSRALPPAIAPGATKGVLGAGTGFGAAALVCDSAGGWLALPSEGGHMGFSFAGAEELAFQACILRERKPQTAHRGATVECEEVLSGRGLTLLHFFLTGERLTPAAVGQAALLQDSPTLRLFARFYGRMCRDWAFATLCSGGVYIAGGIAAKNPLLVTCESFAEAFVSAPSLGDWLKEVPVFLMDCETSGLWGAARHGQDCVARRGQA